MQSQNQHPSQYNTNIGGTVARLNHGEKELRTSNDEWARLSDSQRLKSKGTTSWTTPWMTMKMFVCERETLCPLFMGQGNSIGSKDSHKKHTNIIFITPPTSTAIITIVTSGILTPKANVDSWEHRSVIRPANWWSEKRSDQNTKYNDIDVIKMAWRVDMALHKQLKHI